MNNHFKLFGDQKGNIDRIYKVCDKHHRWYIHYATNIIRDEEKAKEIVIAALNAACQQEENLQCDDDIFNFLFATIVQNSNASRAKMLQDMQPEIRAEIEQEIKEEEKIKKFVLPKGNKNYIITKKVRAAIQDEIEEMPWQRRRIIRLFFCGLKTKKIAEIVGRDKQTVRNERRLASIALFEALQKRNLLFSLNLPPCNSSGFISGSEA